MKPAFAKPLLKLLAEMKYCSLPCQHHFDAEVLAADQKMQFSKNAAGHLQLFKEL